MKVKLLSYTQHPEELVAIAASNCISGSSIDDIIKNLDKSKVIGVINTIKKNQHLSVFEHVSFTFSIEGVSRVLLAQITRHRIASFSVRSMRYAPIEEGQGSMFGSTMEEQRIMRYNTNPLVVSDDSLATFHKAYTSSVKYYEELLSQGVSQENARYVLPNGYKTTIVITMNARELMHFFSLRCCKHAQSEIRVLAKEMSDLVTKVAPILFKDMNGPSCEQLGYCPEGKRSCHRYPTLDELRQAYKEVKKNG